MTFVNKHRVIADEETSLFYIDVNNLYGWALSQSLPYKDFKWIVDDGELKREIEILPNRDTENEETGLLFEVDLSIPSEIHDKLDQLPIAPINQCPPGSKIKKLLLTHEAKENYIIHYRLLQMYMKLGAKVVKIHRAISFKQDRIFKGYIDFNSEKRALASNPFEKDFYKLKNNSLYGKTVENLLKRMDIRLCNTEKKLMIYASKAQFKDTMEIADDLVAVLLDKDIVSLDRPSYIGQAVLDLSKLRMYKLHYEELQSYRERFNCQINIIAGDTDSFFLECKNVSLRNQLIPKMIEDRLLDSSNFDRSDPLYSTSLTAAIGKFKDEDGGKESFIEMIFLRPKSYLMLRNDKKAVMKSKGITLKQTTIRHEDYVESFLTGKERRLEQSRIGSINHQLYTIKSTKKALDPFDDKRMWIDQNNSLAYGHYKLDIL